MTSFPTSYKVTMGPTSEPVTAAEARTHLGLVTDDQVPDSKLEKDITTARLRAESYLNGSIITQTVTLSLDYFPFARSRPINLPRGPVQSITSITYYDKAGQEQTLAADKYQLDNSGDWPRLAPAVGEDWPWTQAGRLGAVKIVYRTGYGGPTQVPKNIKNAILMYLSDIFNYRGSEERESHPAPVTPEDLLADCRYEAL